MEQEDLQYEETTEEVVKGGDSYTEGEEQQLNDMDQSIETELESIKSRVREMEDEAEKLRQIQTEVDKQMNMGSPPPGTATPAALNLSLEEKMEVDARSIYVGNVDYGSTAEDLEQHFHGCGAVNRVTILCNKFDGHPKGFGYVEFSEKDSVHMAMTLDESLFKGRQLKVMPKRTNKHGISTTHRPPRRSMRSRRRAGFSAYRGAMRRPRGRRFFYTPY